MATAEISALSRYSRKGNTGSHRFQSTVKSTYRVTDYQGWSYSQTAEVQIQASDSYTSTAERERNSITYTYEGQSSHKESLKLSRSTDGRNESIDYMVKSASISSSRS